MSDPILTPEQVEGYAATGVWNQAHRRSILASHEALRARLAEVEAERDQRERAAVMEGERRIADIEARLAEAIELLRGLMACHDLPAPPRSKCGFVIEARAFIEAHGEAAQIPSPGPAPQV